MQTVAFLNQKGGVGKTSCTHHLGGAYAALGRRVLLVDADPQSSLTQGLFGAEGLDTFEPDRTVAAILNGLDPFPGDVIHPTVVPGLDLIPGNVTSCRQTTISEPWTAEMGVQRRLASVLTEVSPRYDVCLIDCQPTFYSPSWAALVAADALVVPLQPEDYGAQGIRAMIHIQETVRQVANPRLRLAGYLISMVNSRLSLHKMYEKTLRELYGRDVLDTIIPIATDLKESISAHLPINLYRPRSPSARVIRSLADEIMSRLDGAIGDSDLHSRKGEVA